MSGVENFKNLKRQREISSCTVDNDIQPKTLKLDDSTSDDEDSSQTSSGSESDDSDEMGIEELSEEDTWTLDLRRGKVFTKLLEVFSGTNYPDKITYNGKGFNLTGMYKEFWKTFYNSPLFSKGYKSKLPQLQNLTDHHLNALARIIKRGWEDERYWPEKFAYPFLKCCLFEMSLDEHQDIKIKPDDFFNFIEPTERSVLKKLIVVNLYALGIFNKYSCKVDIGSEITPCSMKAANKIMIEDMRPVIDIWSKYLRNIMPITTFDFLMRQQPKLHWLYTEDLEGCKLPHKLWKTFFLNCSPSKIRYYITLMRNDDLGRRCSLCRGHDFDARHLISKCPMAITTSFLKRHDAVLRVLHFKCQEAIERGVAYFKKGTNWKMLVMYNNEQYEWPRKDLKVSFDNSLYPHMMVYCLTPSKKMLLIEITISWELWIERKDKEERYAIVKEKLEDAGFSVEFLVLVLGSRGVVTPKLYNLLHTIFGMKHSEVSKTLEVISRMILNIPYKYYRKKSGRSVW